MSIHRVLREFRPDIVITECALTLPNIWLLFAWRKFVGFKILFWTHGYEDYWRTRPRMTEMDRIRKLWFRWSDGLIMYSRRGCAEVMQTTRPCPSVSVAPNTVDTVELDRVYQSLVAEGRERVRARLGMSGLSFVFIGRMAWYKRALLLPEIMTRLSGPAAATRIYVIGGGPEDSEFRRRAVAFGDRIQIVGPLTEPEKKGAYLFGADLMICPGSLGLNTVDTLAFGCPIAFIDGRALPVKHGPEADYLRPGENSLMAADAYSLAETISRGCTDAGLFQTLRENARTTFERECKIEFQEKGVIEAINKAWRPGQV